MKKPLILVPPAVMRKGRELDADGMARYYSKMADFGVGGLFLNGSTGEFTTLSDAQKTETVRIAKAAVGGRMFLVAGTIAGSPDLVIELADACRAAGADAIAVAPPPFFRHGQPGVIRFMNEVADRSPLPMYLYDIPAFTSPMTFETIVELSSHPNIHGLKDSSRDFARFEELIAEIKAHRPEFKILTGSEELLLASLIMGADGATVATGGLEPQTVMGIVDAWMRGDSETARKLFVHRNTLVYRLEKIKKLTGLDLREFDDAITFKVALMVKKYLASRGIEA